MTPARLIITKEKLVYPHKPVSRPGATMMKSLMQVLQPFLAERHVNTSAMELGDWMDLAVGLTHGGGSEFVLNYGDHGIRMLKVGSPSSIPHLWFVLVITEASLADYRRGLSENEWDVELTSALNLLILAKFQDLIELASEEEEHRQRGQDADRYNEAILHP